MSITTTGTTLTFNDGTTMTTVVFPSGTAMLFQQTAAPTGRTKVTTYNDYAVRIVNGTAATGGSVAFTTAFKSQAVTGTNSGGAVSATSLSTSQLASHNHALQSSASTSACSPRNNNYRAWTNCCGRWSVTSSCSGLQYYAGSFMQNTGCNAAHSHGFTQPTFSGTAINLAVNYVDHIIATKN